MKVTDFLNDWWNSLNTSNPTFQDAIDWTERRHLEEIREVRQQRDIIYEVKSQFLIEVACKKLEDIIGSANTDLVDKFRKEMEEYMNYA